MTMARFRRPAPEAPWFPGESWPPYLPVAERRERAERQVGLLARLGLQVQPVRISGRTVARSVWGRTWCHHLESFSDYANRLPRGRSYVRHGAVVHLELVAGRILALVHGTETYHVEITVGALDPGRWQEMIRTCAGQVDSLLALLRGEVPPEVMAVVADRDRGLLPRPGEISLACSCPDGAVMCKHVAAVLYGVGNRLDTAPELLFELRGVAPDDLLAGAATAGPTTAAAGTDTLDAADLGEIFGLQLDDPAPDAPPEAAAATDGLAAGPATPGHPWQPTAAQIRRARRRLRMSVAAFASHLGVTASTVTRWESKQGRLRLYRRARTAVREVIEATGA
jgi:uncharacterized Zn finger protein